MLFVRVGKHALRNLQESFLTPCFVLLEKDVVVAMIPRYLSIGCCLLLDVLGPVLFLGMKYIPY